MVRTIAIIIYIARRLVSTITAVLISVSGECTTDHGDVSIYIYRSMPRTVETPDSDGMHGMDGGILGSLPRER